jgi:hypothetical protein
MRWLAACVLVLSTASRAFASTDGRFDHAVHKKNPVPCNDCHRLSASSGWLQKIAVGKAGEVHEPCSGGKCHFNKYVRFNKSKDLPFCLECHVDRPQGKLRYPPYRDRGAGDFWLARFDHGVHLAQQGSTCESCHAPRKSPIKGREIGRSAHEGCASAPCHGEKTPPKMNACEGCHKSREGAEVQIAASSAPSHYRVSTSFAHAAHEKSAKSNVCKDCHTNTAVKMGELVPLPPMIACEHCHDGKAAFAALGTACTKCHGQGGARERK